MNHQRAARHGMSIGSKRRIITSGCYALGCYVNAEVLIVQMSFWRCVCVRDIFRFFRLLEIQQYDLDIQGHIVSEIQ